MAKFFSLKKNELLNYKIEVQKKEDGIIIMYIIHDNMRMYFSGIDGKIFRKYLFTHNVDDASEFTSDLEAAFVLNEFI